MATSQVVKIKYSDKLAFLDPEINWKNFKSIKQKFPLLYFSYMTSHEQIFLLLLYKNTFFFFVKENSAHFLFIFKKRKKNSAKKSLHNLSLCTKISSVNCLIISNLICMTINFSNVGLIEVLNTRAICEWRKKNQCHMIITNHLHSHRTFYVALTIKWDGK